MHLNLYCSASRVLIAAARWLGACGSDDPLSTARIFQFGDQDFAHSGATISNWNGVLSISFALQQR